MSDKDRRFAQLQHDLRDGRIKLPEDHAFEREYLGEWKDDRADAMAYAATATALHKCALCGIAIAGGRVTADEFDCLTAAHHAVCPKRPIAVGDYVRWEYGPTGPFEKPENWAEGEVVRINPYHVDIRVERCGLSKRAGTVTTFGHGVGIGSTIRRIPRPGASEQPVELDCYVEWKPDGSRSQAAGQVIKMDGDRATVRIREVSQMWTAFEACPFSSHARTIPLYQLRRIAWPHEGPVPVPVDQPRGGRHDPAPVAVPATAEDLCLVQWMENRVAVEGGAPPPNPMTPQQIAIARAAWQAQYGAQRSAELRLRVERRAAAEANPVRVDPEVLPWE
jgi:hypothetical protein